MLILNNNDNSHKDTAMIDNSSFFGVFIFQLQRYHDILCIIVLQCITESLDCLTIP